MVVVLPEGEKAETTPHPRLEVEVGITVLLVLSGGGVAVMAGVETISDGVSMMTTMMKKKKVKKAKNIRPTLTQQVALAQLPTSTAKTAPVTNEDCTMVIPPRAHVRRPAAIMLILPWEGIRRRIDHNHCHWKRLPRALVERGA